jgi:hypothetical protein
MSWPSVVIITSVRGYDPVVERVGSLGVAAVSSPDERSLFWEGHSYDFDFSGRVLSDFEPEEVSHVTSNLGDPRVIYVSCQSIGAARSLLAVLLDGLSGLIDLNNGEILAFAEFLRLLDGNPDWDWRRTTAEELA